MPIIKQRSHKMKSNIFSQIPLNSWPRAQSNLRWCRVWWENLTIWKIILCINVLMFWCAAIFSVCSRSSTCVGVIHVWVCSHCTLLYFIYYLCIVSTTAKRRHLLKYIFSPTLLFFMCKNKQTDGNTQFVASQLISCFEELCAALHFARANFSLSRVWSETAVQLFTADQQGHLTSNCDIKFLKFQTNTLQPTPLLWSHLCL